MPKEFTYPVLFHPNEQWYGHFNDGRTDYVTVFTDIPGGFMVKVLHLSKSDGRRQVCSISSISFSSALEAAYKKQLADIESVRVITEKVEQEQEDV